MQSDDFARRYARTDALCEPSGSRRDKENTGLEKVLPVPGTGFMAVLDYLRNNWKYLTIQGLYCIFLMLCAVVAQVVERILGKDEVRQFESAQQLQRSNA